MYERRIINSNCRNGLRYGRKISVEKCQCARSDYICDFGFRKVVNGRVIIFDDSSHDFPIMITLIMTRY